MEILALLALPLMLLGGLFLDGATSDDEDDPVARAAPEAGEGEPIL